jgi:hypothetical protein
MAEWGNEGALVQITRAHLFDCHFELQTVPSYPSTYIRSSKQLRLGHTSRQQGCLRVESLTSSAGQSVPNPIPFTVSR